MKQNQICYYFVMLALYWVVLVTSDAYAACSVRTTSIIFGNYDVLSSVADTGTGTISLSCTPGADVTISIGASSNSGAFYPRRMVYAGLGDTLDYNLYTSAAMIQVWGDGTNGTVTAYYPNVKRSNTPLIRIYGKIDPQQNVPAGNYSEQLVVTITY